MKYTALSTLLMLVFLQSCSPDSSSTPVTAKLQNDTVIGGVETATLDGVYKAQSYMCFDQSGTNLLATTQTPTSEQLTISGNQLNARISYTGGSNYFEVAGTVSYSQNSLRFDNMQIVNSTSQQWNTVSNYLAGIMAYPNDKMTSFQFSVGMNLQSVNFNNIIVGKNGDIYVYLTNGKSGGNCYLFYQKQLPTEVNPGFEF